MNEGHTRRWLVWAPMVTMLAIVAIALYQGWLGPFRSAPTPISTVQTRSSGHVLFGTAPDPDVPPLKSVTDTSRLVNHRVDVLHRFVSMALREQTQLELLRTLSAASDPERFVMITLEPGKEGSAGGVSLEAIASGGYDNQLRRFAAGLAHFEGPVALRFGHEMNGSWYPWAGRPESFRQAWIRVTAIVRHEAPAVRMVWAVNNVDQPRDNSLEQYWPGADQVDIIGIDGYNCLQGWWERPAELFQTAVQRTAALGPRVPIWLTETASCEAQAGIPRSWGQDKAGWIVELFQYTERSGIQAVVWFDRNKEHDWRIASSPESAAAMTRALAEL